MRGTGVAPLGFVEREVAGLLSCTEESQRAIRRTAFDEMVESDGVRPPYRLVSEWLEKAPQREFDLRRREAELLFRRIGITFAVYSEGGDPAKTSTTTRGNTGRTSAFRFSPPSVRCYQGDSLFADGALRCGGFTGTLWQCPPPTS